MLNTSKSASAGGGIMNLAVISKRQNASHLETEMGGILTFAVWQM
jgi:hypothetical protein